MEYFVIADGDTVLGFRYAGVEGRVARTADEARAALAEQVALRRAGIIVVTDAVESWVSAEVNRLRLASSFPIVVTVSGPAGPSADRRDLLRLIREALGIRL